MNDSKPKLLLVDAPPGASDELKQQLGDRYEVIGQSELPLPNPQAEMLLQALGEGVCLANRSGDIVWSNDYFLRLDEPIRDRVAEFCRESAEHMTARLSEPNTEPASLACKFQVDSDSTYFDVYITVAVGEGAHGCGFHHVAAVVRDVTIQRRTQQKMDAIDRAGYELARFDIEQIRKMNAMERLALLEQKIVRYTRELLNFDHFAIFLLDRSGTKLQLIMSEGLPAEIQDLDLYSEAEGSGISGHVAATGVSYICRDATTDERFLPGLSGARSSLTVPLRVHDKVIGIMDIESRQADQFDEQDKQFVEIFARHIAMALHMLDLLVVERSSTNQIVSGRFEGELNEPLDDICHEVDWLRAAAAKDPESAAHIARIIFDVDSIRRRMRDVAEGPQTLLGIDRAMAHREKDPLLEGRRILVADDTAKVRKIIGEILTHRGCEVVRCSEGATAIEHLRASARGDEPPFDLIVSDIQMPDRNGYEVFAEAQKSQPGVPVILMTGFGYDPHHSIVRASQEGLQSVLFKPFEIELLIDQVRNALEPSATSP